MGGFVQWALTVKLALVLSFSSCSEMVKRHRSASMEIELIQQNLLLLLPIALLFTHPGKKEEGKRKRKTLPSFLSSHPPLFFSLLSPPPLPSPNPVRHLVRIRRRLVSFGCIHFFWWYIVLVRNFIYCRCPLLNLLLVSEHDKRISSMLLHSSYIVLGSQISHMRFRKKLLNRHKGSHQDQLWFH